MALGGVNVSGVMQSDIEEVKQDIQDVSNLIGEAENTGGTITDGTVMAKMNKMLEDINNISQQLNVVQYRASNTLQSTDIYEFTLDDRRKYKKIKQFYAKYNGYIHANITASSPSQKIDMFIFRSLHDYFNIENGDGYKDNSNAHMMIPALFMAPEGSILNSFMVRMTSLLYKSSTSHPAPDFMNQISGTNKWVRESGTWSGYTIMDVVFPVKKGEQVVFVGNFAYDATAPISTTIKMYYDEVAI